MGLALATAIAIPVLGGFLGATATFESVRTWYKTINKPSWTPPDRVFGPVWTALYTAMGYSSYLVWKTAPKAVTSSWSLSNPLLVYGGHLVLNFLWSPLFFKFRRVDLALVDIVALWASIVGTMYSFYPYSRTASYLMVPYLGWVSYATALNFSIWRRNRNVTKSNR
eukprot:TRINITY_DN3558_c0_g1_i3.p1 TRINITY_DN3558_c0_g1~~TRINITY_DN3558_c0_g1_i3.p1  ORF type:complete len:167 (-),score=37.99 TRINITY_DN3558_c0_g1_i3:66-566(-)